MLFFELTRATVINKQIHGSFAYKKDPVIHSSGAGQTGTTEEEQRHKAALREIIVKAQNGDFTLK